MLSKIMRKAKKETNTINDMSIEFIVALKFFFQEEEIYLTDEGLWKVCQKAFFGPDIFFNFAYQDYMEK